MKLLMLRKTHDDKVNELNKTIKNYIDACNKIQNHKQVLYRENTILKEDIVVLKKELEKIKNKCNKLFSSNGGYSTANKKLKKEISNLENKIKSISNIMIAYKTSSDSYRDAIDEYFNPTKVECEYSNKKVNKGKMVNSDRREKIQRLKQYRKEIEEKLNAILENELKVTQVSEHEYKIEPNE